MPRTNPTANTFRLGSRGLSYEPRNAVEDRKDDDDPMPQEVRARMTDLLVCHSSLIPQRAAAPPPAASSPGSPAEELENAVAEIKNEGEDDKAPHRCAIGCHAWWPSACTVLRRSTRSISLTSAHASRGRMTMMATGR
jgi:hypothetical protein